jgi:hypothetical protein
MRTTLTRPLSACALIAALTLAAPAGAQDKTTFAPSGNHWMDWENNNPYLFEVAAAVSTSRRTTNGCAGSIGSLRCGRRRPARPVPTCTQRCFLAYWP